MFRRVVGGLINLFGRLTGRGTKSIDTRLDAIEERLERIEDKIQSRDRLASFAFIYGVGWAIIAIGIAMWPEYGAAGLSLMLFGLFALIVVSLFYYMSMRR